jgi:hypothetical protein
MNPQKISLAIITGNIGAPMMNRFLDHFWQVADEIIVVRAIGDQPPDESLDVAKARGCVVGEYLNYTEERPDFDEETGLRSMDMRMPSDPAYWPHVDNFAAARNLAWSMATGDWIMWADTDDIITPEAAAAIRAAIEEKGERFDMLQTPYCVPDAGLLDNPRERVVRRGIARWAQPVHECLEPIDPAAKWRTATCAEGRIVHDPGPRPPAARNGRNLRILESLPPDQLTTSLRYHLFAELFAMGRKAEGALAAEQFLLLKDAGPVERFECALSLSMVAEDPADKAQWLQLAWHECPHRREPLVLLSNLALNADDPTRAEAYLRAASALPLPQPAPWNLRRKMWGWQFIQEQARVLRTQGNFPKAEALETNHFRRHGARISLLHATRGRAQQAIETRALWLERAADPDAIEHIFGLDPDDPEGPALGGFRHIIQDSHDGGPCGAWNIAATVAAGEVFVQVSDDMIPPQGWDRAILDALGVTTVPAVLRVSDGHRTDGLIVLAIVTRAWWKQESYLFHPAFFSMFSDNWLTECAQKAGAIIEAPHLVFEHRHPVFTGEPMHPTTANSNSLLHYATGAKILAQLRAGREAFTWRDIPGCVLDPSPAKVHARIIGQLEAPVCVEVGVANGRGLACMATLAEFRGGRAVGIDTFLGTPGESEGYPPDMMARSFENIARCSIDHVTGLRCASSLEAVQDIPDAAYDYVFLDAAHDYESIRADIDAWWPKIKPGGWLAGHDYTDAEGVRRAVDEAFPAAEKLGTCWLVQKPLA